MECMDCTSLKGEISKKEREELLRRQCGCLRTSEKLKQILNSFPSPPPPSPQHTAAATPPRKSLVHEKCISSYCTHVQQPAVPPLLGLKQNTMEKLHDCPTESREKDESMYKVWGIVAELVKIIQLSVTATALALYYLLYCYMQLVYYTLKTALYFHNADGPMKITIGVVTLTTIVIGFNLILQLERILVLMFHH